MIGGGSAGSTAAIAAQQALPRGRVILLEKAPIIHDELRPNGVPH